MTSIKDLKAAQKAAAEQRQIVSEMRTLVGDIDRCQKTIGAVNDEFQAANARYQGERTTRQDVEYLTILLDCAKRKLAWEKQIGSVQKRTPELLERLQTRMNDEKNPPGAEVREQMVAGLQALQGAMERLQQAKVR
jgi:phage host-nuclease inhibitor protein Gam